MTVAALPGTGLVRTEDHRYSWQGGPLWPGVTSIIATLDKSGPLIGWAKREVAQAAIRNLDTLPGLVRQGGPEAAAKWLGSIPGYQRDTSADLGTRIHALAEAVSGGQDVPVTDEERPFLAEFLRWLERRKPRYLATEFMVCHLGLRYGGTGDALLVLDGETWLIDYKTGKSVYPETALQLAGLGGAQFMGTPDDPTQHKLPHIDCYGVLHIRPDGAELYPMTVGKPEWEAFKACRTLWEWLNVRVKEERR